MDAKKERWETVDSTDMVLDWDMWWDLVNTAISPRVS
jgi:hypothetical protein